MSDIFEVAEGVRYQTSDETRIYTVNTALLVNSPTNTNAVVYDESVDADVTNVCMNTGSFDETNNVITLKPLTALTKDHSYRIEFTFDVGTSIYERYFRVKCTR